MSGDQDYTMFSVTVNLAVNHGPTATPEEVLAVAKQFVADAMWNHYKNCQVTRHGEYQGMSFDSVSDVADIIAIAFQDE